ncbi:MAG: hypothetical protein KC478_05920, partial [Bacteriovoracaceae bacterium]|nr:hypothetical protein [Bacteriovoracaceae bacterium]
MTLLKRYRVVLLFVTVAILSLLYPVYFVADDWEHLNAYYGVGPDNYLRPWLYRLPGLYFTHQLLFPLFKNEFFFLGNFICWGFFLMGTLLVFDFLGVYKKLNKEPLWFYLMFCLMTMFNPNNFEWLFWPTVMVNFPGFFAVCLGIWITGRYKLWVFQILKGFLWAYGFYCYESLFFFGALVELSRIAMKDDGHLFEKFKMFTYQLLGPVLVIFGSKVILSSMESYPYVSKVGFKLHLFLQSMSMIFLHDYYKTRWLTGSLFLISTLLLFIYLFRRRSKKNFLNKEFILIIATLLSVSYYFIIMDYSARRAIGGQLFFSWGSFCFIYL